MSIHNSGHGNEADRQAESKPRPYRRRINRKGGSSRLSQELVSRRGYQAWLAEVTFRD